MSTPGRILIVDDDALFAESIRDLLEAQGYEIHTAANGADGVRQAQALRPDLIILDVMMTTPTEGIDTARTVRELPGLRQVPILLVTGVTHAMRLPHPPRPDKDWLPVDRVLEKPVDPPRLIAEVERLLKSKDKGVT